MDKCLRLTWMVLAAGICGCSADLDKQLQERERQLINLSDQLEQNAPPIFVTDREFRSDLKYLPVQDWIGDVTTPEFVISIVGVARSGEIVYRGGIGKAWLEPEHDTKGFVRIRGVKLAGSTSGLTFDGQILADLETRIKFEILRVGGNVFCRGKMTPKALNGAFRILPIYETKLPYQMEMGSPGETRVRVECGLGRLGPWRRDFVLGELTPNVSSGTLELGLADSGRVTLPAEVGGAELKYRVALSRPAVETTTESVKLETDIDVRIEQ